MNSSVVPGKSPISRSFPVSLLISVVLPLLKTPRTAILSLGENVFLIFSFISSRPWSLINEAEDYIYFAIYTFTLQSVADALVEAGYKICVFDNLESQVHSEEQNVPNYLNPGVEFIKGDVRDR